MCDQDQLGAMGAAMSRRQFAKFGALATAAACAPLYPVQAQRSLPETEVTFDTPAGKMDGFLVNPAEGKHPGIIVWPDIAGLRDSFMSMARRLAREGYSAAR